jgi:putative ABC transport system permease protein
LIYLKKKALRPPKIAEYLLKLFANKFEHETLIGDFDELYQITLRERGRFFANQWYWRQILRAIPSFFINTVYWSFYMFRNYLKVALRTVKRQRIYSFINILGLAIGIACCLMIYLYVSYEMSYDKFYPDFSRIYRVATDNRFQSRSHLWALSPAPLAPVLEEGFPQIEIVARIMRRERGVVEKDEQLSFADRIFYADAEVFRLFSIPFLIGEPSSALLRPHTMVITQSIAGIYFEHNNPIGQTLNIDGTEYEVTGVVPDAPSNTHLKYNIIMTINDLADDYHMSSWNHMYLYTYLKLSEGAKPNGSAEKIRHVADPHTLSQTEEGGMKQEYFLQPVGDIHLHSHLIAELGRPGNPLYLYIFSAVGLVILLLACINFMNLATARSANRAKEVGMRKVIGANRTQLISQFLGESLLTAFLALVLSVLIAEILRPFFNDLSRKEFLFTDFFQLGLLYLLIGLMLFVGFAAGSYPALLLSSFKPVTILRGFSSEGTRSAVLRKALVIFQFAVSVFLIICTFVIYRQIGFMKDYPLGFEKKQKLVIPVREEISNNYETIKNEFLYHPSVLRATVSSSTPGRGVHMHDFRMVEGDKTERHSFQHLYVDLDFLQTYEIEIIAGRPFQREMRTDVSEAFIVNESVVRVFGLDSPQKALGKTIDCGDVPKKIVGVINDFHFYGLQGPTEPLVLEIKPSKFNFITLSVNTANLSDAFSFFEEKWRGLFPGHPFEYFFLDEDFNLQYQSEEQMGELFTVFTFFGLIIACLGLFGLASFTAQQRTKEIGIRKVLGASVSKIALLLTKDISKWVLVASLFSWPIAYFASKKWLQNFAFQADLHFSIFILATLTTLIIALLTVSYQAMKAAMSNPVDVLRHE